MNMLHVQLNYFMHDCFQVYIPFLYVYNIRICLHFVCTEFYINFLVLYVLYVRPYV